MLVYVQNYDIIQTLNPNNTFIKFNKSLMLLPNVYFYNYQTPHNYQAQNTNSNSIQLFDVSVCKHDVSTVRCPQAVLPLFKNGKC